jgi:D-alanyl-D-alanine carboxypeptidase
MENTSSPIQLCLCLMAAIAGCADADGNVRAPDTLRADLEAILEDSVANKLTPGGVVEVSTRHGESWSVTAGVADLRDQTAMAPDEHFRAGSILKTFVATAVLQGVESGALSLDDVLTDHLPLDVTARIEHAGEIQLRMLLAHRSGIPEWVDGEVRQAVVADPAHVWSLGEVLDRVAAQPALFQPGERYSYSNTNYLLLGEILSRVSGSSWRQVIREHVLARAGLERSLLPEDGDLECPAPCAHGYVPVNAEMVDVTRVDPSMAGAAGGHSLITTTADLTSFLQALRGGALFDAPSTLEAMFDFQPALDPETRSVGYGFGVMEMESNGRTVLGHLGTAAGYHGFMLYVPQTDRYVSGFFNVMGDLGALLEPIVERVTAP